MGAVVVVFVVAVVGVIVVAAIVVTVAVGDVAWQLKSTNGLNALMTASNKIIKKRKLLHNSHLLAKQSGFMLDWKAVDTHH